MFYYQVGDPLVPRSESMTAFILLWRTEVFTLSMFLRAELRCDINVCFQRSHPCMHLIEIALFQVAPATQHSTTKVLLLWFLLKGVCGPVSSFISNYVLLGVQIPNRENEQCMWELYTETLCAIYLLATSHFWCCNIPILKLVWISSYLTDNSAAVLQAAIGDSLAGLSLLVLNVSS